MKRKRVIPISQLALASILAFVNPVFASTAGLNHRAGFPERALVVSDGGSVVAQGGMLRERERAKTREVEEELERNPKLVNDPHYLAQHPKLARYLERHPESEQTIERDPKAFFA